MAKYQPATMFVVTYTDGRKAYVVVDSRRLQEDGDDIALTVTREEQDKGNIPPGEIASVKRAH